MGERMHTPTPWAAEEGTIHHIGHTVITAAHAGMTSNTPLAKVSHLGDEESARADAAFIVRAVNSHDQLVEALEKIMGIAGCCVSQRIPSDDKIIADHIEEIYDNARAALSAAKE